MKTICCKWEIPEDEFRGKPYKHDLFFAYIEITNDGSFHHMNVEICSDVLELDEYNLDEIRAIRDILNIAIEKGEQYEKEKGVKIDGIPHIKE